MRVEGLSLGILYDVASYPLVKQDSLERRSPQLLPVIYLKCGDLGPITFFGWPAVPSIITWPVYPETGWGFAALEYLGIVQHRYNKCLYSPPA